MKKHFVSVVIMLIFMLFISSTIVLATSDNTGGLPGVELFMPDISVSQEMIHPIFKVINWFVIGPFSLWLLLKSSFCFLKIAAGVFTGGSWEGAFEKLKNVGVGLLLIICVITGGWYKIIYYFWGKVSPKLGETGFFWLQDLNVIHNVIATSKTVITSTFHFFS